MKIDRYPYRASAWWDGRVVAQSDRCLCVETPGALPVLYFPLADIDLEGSAGLSDHVRPAEPARELADHAAFDQDRVRIEVIDEAEGDAAHDVTVKRFPTWGDAAHLVDVMDVRPADDGLTFFGVARGDERRPVVEGSQMLGQAIVAASRHAPGRRVMSATMIMVRAADAHQPLQFELVELSSGPHVRRPVGPGSAGRTTSAPRARCSSTRPPPTSSGTPPPPRTCRDPTSALRTIWG